MNVFEVNEIERTTYEKFGGEFKAVFWKNFMALNIIILLI